jgi:hypothetical protein
MGPFDTRAKIFMLSLLYPAFLGANVVFMADSLGSLFAAQVLGWWVLLLVYLSAQFTELSTTYSSSYQVFPGFVIDLVEVVGFAGMFVLLRGLAASNQVAVDWRLFYVLLLALFLIPIVYRRTHEPTRHELGLIDSAVVGAVLLAGYGAIVSSVDLVGVPPWQTLPQLSRSLCLALILPLTIYFALVAIRAAAKEWPNSNWGKLWRLCNGPRLARWPLQLSLGLLIGVISLGLAEVLF